MNNSDPLELKVDTENAILRLGMRSARMGTWTRDLITEKVEWSPELEEVFGLMPGRFGGTRQDFVAFVHEEDRPAIIQAVQRAIAEHTDYTIEFRFRHESGEWRWMEGRGQAVYDESGRPVRLYGVGIDITERKQAEHTRAHLAAIVESSEDAIVSKTFEGYITSWNQGAERLFGYTSQEVVGKPITLIIPPELHPEEQEILRKLRKGERIEHYETTRVTKDGRRVQVSLTVSPIRDKSGGLTGASKIARDVTERRATEAKLRENEARLRSIAAEREMLLGSERAARSEAEQLSRIKDEFLATLSHELRTPLNAIQGWATLLRQPNVSPADRARGLETIERNARAQAQIINDLLDMSRIVSGKTHLEVQPIYLHEVVEAAVEAVRPSAEAKRIRLQTLLDSRIGRTRGDPNRLQQVLWNLLANAVKFTPAGGNIQIILERVNSHAQIVVTDTGVGIKAEFLPFVFDRFRQADASISRRHGGLGLGLSIVKNLVELHGGTVRVKSAGENQGSTFIVELPLAAAGVELKTEEGEAAHRGGPVLALPQLNDINVLVVDDEADARLLITRILEEQGARALSARNSLQALELLGRERVDIMLSDIGMPDSDGYDLIHRVRTLDKGRLRPLPAIAVTAYARAEDRQRSLLAGYQMHIAKPIEAGELIAAVAGLLQISR